MSEIVTLPAELRTDLGTGASRNVRREGKVPAIIYGPGHQPMSVLLEEKEITKLYRKHGFKSTVIELDVSGKKHKVLAQSVQLNPITDIVRHVDFIFLADKVQKVNIPVVFEGKEKSLGIKRGGYFNVIHRSVAMLCDVKKIPQDIVIDVVNMGIGTSIFARHLKLPAGCELVSKKDFVIASITGRGGKADATEDTAATATA
jgi:large subunit ribosomal protein L25